MWILRSYHFWFHVILRVISNRYLSEVIIEENIFITAIGLGVINTNTI